MAETPQLAAWCGEFGDAYIGRNQATDAAVRARVRAWSRILSTVETRQPASILEVGANIGINLRALSSVVDATLYGLEPNARAREELAKGGVVAPQHALDGTAQAIPLADGAVDLVFTSGVLIHIHPEDLPAVYREMVRVARHYVVLIEYFATQPVSIPYRGHDGLLFKCDFGGALLDHARQLTLLDYGFFWSRATGLDDLTWWLFEKKS